MLKQFFVTFTRGMAKVFHTAEPVRVDLTHGFGWGTDRAVTQDGGFSARGLLLALDEFRGMDCRQTGQSAYHYALIDR